MLKNQKQSQSIERTLIQKQESFDYAILEAETRKNIQQYTNEIKGLMNRTVQNTIEIGQKLIEVKEQLGHGNFTNWLKFEFHWSISTATRFMQVGEQFKFIKMANLDIAASALYLLAAPSTPDKARKETLGRAMAGEAITCTLTKEIVNRHKKIAKSDIPEKHTINVSSKTVTCACEADLNEQSEDMLNTFDSTTLSSNNNDCLTAKTQALSPLKVGKQISITDEQQQHKWLGEVTELKEATASSIEVVIKVRIQVDV